MFLCIGPMAAFEKCSYRSCKNKKLNPRNLKQTLTLSLSISLSRSLSPASLSLLLSHSLSRFLTLSQCLGARPHHHRCARTQHLWSASHQPPSCPPRTNPPTEIHKPIPIIMLLPASTHNLLVTAGLHLSTSPSLSLFVTLPNSKTQSLIPPFHQNQNV